MRHKHAMGGMGEKKIGENLYCIMAIKKNNLFAIKKEASSLLFIVYAAYVLKKIKKSNCKIIKIGYLLLLF